MSNDRMDGLKTFTRGKLPWWGALCVICEVLDRLTPLPSERVSADGDKRECEVCGNHFHESCYWRAIAPESEQATWLGLQDAPDDDEMAKRYVWLCYVCRS